MCFSSTRHEAVGFPLSYDWGGIHSCVFRQFLLSLQLHRPYASLTESISITICVSRQHDVKSWGFPFLTTGAASTVVCFVTCFHAAYLNIKSCRRRKCSNYLLVHFERIPDHLVRLLDGLVRSVTFLPQELATAEERRWVFELPAHNVAPLVDFDGQVAVTLNPLGKLRVPVITWRIMQGRFGG